MKRGEVWTIAAHGNLSKPRPAVVVQSDRIETVSTVIVCPLTSTGGYIEPTDSNGLLEPSAPMATQIAAIKRARLGRKIGELAERDMAKVSEQLRIVLRLE